MDEHKDIEKFDALENKTPKSTLKEDHNLMVSIKSLDHLMQSNNTYEVSSSFTKNLIYQALNPKQNVSNSKIIKLLAFIFLPIIIVSISVVLLNSGTIESPAVVTQILEKFNVIVQFTTDPKVQQFFLISEGIILLIIIEKIASSYRFYRHSANG